MPIYVYECLKCGAVVEKRQSFDDEPLTNCDECNGELQRVIHPTPVVYKGSGFYSTDHKPDTRVKGTSGKLGRRVSETDESNIDSGSPTRVDAKGRPHITPTRPKPRPVNMPS